MSRTPRWRERRRTTRSSSPTRCEDTWSTAFTTSIDFCYCFSEFGKNGHGFVCIAREFIIIFYHGWQLGLVWFMIPIYATGGQQSRRKIDCVAMLANLNVHVQYDEDSVG